MTLQPGTRLGPYEILESVGAGGMGHVYKARDARLNRLVAIKQSTIEFSARFEHEARAVGALNHQNVCQVYDVGPDYLVLEFVEGHPLAAVDGIRKLLDLAVQIAGGMAAAHAAGIVHRDLKPDNVLVTADGGVKILDFGIAKAIAGDAAEQHTRASLTDAGTAVGTVHYMSPEQARGMASLGPQSDQFSFGLILYELLTGQKAFARASNAETLTAIIREDAAPLPTSVPTPLRWIVERLLAKDPAERYDSSRDLYRELKQLRDRFSDATAPISGVTSATTVAPRSGSQVRRWLAIVAALTLAAAAGAMGWALASRGRTGDVDLTAYRFTPLSSETESEREPAWSPDGRSIAYTASVDGILQVMVREVGATAAVQLTRGEAHARVPLWAPDGSRVYFVRGPVPALWSVSPVGGDAELEIEGATSAAIHPDGNHIVVARSGGLWLFDRGAAAGASNLRRFGQASFEGSAEVQTFSPDGAQVAVVKDQRLWLLAYPGGEARQLAIGNVFAMGKSMSWLPDNRRIVTYFRDTQDRLRISDVETGASRTIYTSPAAILNPTVSPDGARLAFVTGNPRWKLVEVSLTDGRVRELGVSSHVSWFPSLHPDGTRLAFVEGLEGNRMREMTLAPTGEVVGRTITSNTEAAPGIMNVVEWSPDGARILFQLSAGTAIGGKLMVAPAAGGRAVPVDSEESRDGVWSPDGAQIVYRRRIGNEHQIAIVRVGTSAAPVIIKRWSAEEDATASRTPAAWSPDRQWILTRRGPNLFLMAADGSSEHALPTMTAPFGRARPIFSRDGRELLLFRRDGTAPRRPLRLFAANIASGQERIVVTVDFPVTADDIAGLTISPDGKRLYTSFADWPFDIWMLEGFR